MKVKFQTGNIALSEGNKTTHLEPILYEAEYTPDERTPDELVALIKIVSELVAALRAAAGK